MGATIGINSMILLGILSYILKADGFASVRKAAIAKGLRLAHLSLFVFWIALITAGLLKGYRDVALGMSSFQEMMAPVMSVLKVFSFAGVFLFLSMSVIVWQLMAGKVVTVDEGSFVKPVAIPSTLPSEPLKKTVL